MSGVLVITGGSRGIGAATAEAAARAGYAVAFGYGESRDAAQALVARIRGAGGRVEAVQGDIADEGAVAALFDAAEAAFGPVTALFNNAGITGPIRRLADLDLTDLRRVMDINVIGSFIAAREVGGEGIRVNAVAPGLIETEIHAIAGDAGRVARLMPSVPMGRAGSAQEVASVVLWLMSDQAAYVNGAVVPIGGGR